MENTVRRRVPWVVRVLFAIDGLLIAFYVVDTLAGHPLGGGWAREFFHLELEQNLPTWFSSVQLAVAAVLLGIFVAHRSRHERGRSRLTLALPFVVLFMSLDEIAQIHEKIGFKSDALLPEGTRAVTPFPYTGIWMFLVGVPFLVLTLLAFRRLVRGPTIRASGFRKVLFGLVLLAAGAGGVEVWANFTFDKPMLHLVQVSLEEGLELFGGTLIVWGAIELLFASGVRLVGNFGDSGSRY